jgi:hypothetical protein
VIACAIGGCIGGDDGAPATSAPVDTTPAIDVDAVARAAALTRRDLPAAWRTIQAEPTRGLDDTCPPIARRLQDATGDVAATEQRAARVRDTGLPALRQRVDVLPTVAAAREMYEVRASDDFARCLAETVAGQSVLAGPREVDPGRLGDASSSWVVPVSISADGLALDANLEVVTFRNGPIVNSLVLSSSPLFPLDGDVRSGILRDAARRVQQALRRAT